MRRSFVGQKIVYADYGLPLNSVVVYVVCVCVC